MKKPTTYDQFMKMKKKDEHYTQALKRLGMTQSDFSKLRAKKAGTSQRYGKRKYQEKAISSETKSKLESGKVVMIITTIDQAKELLG